MGLEYEKKFEDHKIVAIKVLYGYIFFSGKEIKTSKKIEWDVMRNQALSEIDIPIITGLIGK